MTANLEIPLSLRISSEVISIPLMGKSILSFFGNKLTKQYRLINFSLIGFKEEILNRHTHVDENDLILISRLESILSIVYKTANGTNNHYIDEVYRHVKQSLETIDELKIIIKDFIKHDKLLNNMIATSNKAITDHLLKYS